jgi:tonB-dependent receptor plug
MRCFYITFLLTVWGTAACWAQDEGEKEIVLKEVVVTATRAAKNLKDVPITVQVITAEDIRKSQATNFQSFLESEFAGINFTYDGGMPNINMLGFGGKYVLFLMDGERMAGETFDNIDYNRIDLDNIERIEIIKGASSSLYGSNALGGVINIITKEAKKAFEGNLSYLYDTSHNYKTNVGVGTKLRWGSIRLTSFYNFRAPYVLEDTEPLISYKNGVPVAGALSTLPIAGFTNYGITPKVSVKLLPKTELSLTPNYYFSERNRGDNERVLDRYYNYALSGKVTTDFSETQKLSLSGAFDRYDKLYYYRLLNEEEKNYENTIWRGAGQYNLTIAGKHSVVAGAEVLQDELLSFRFNDAGTALKKNAENYTLFTQQEWKLLPDFTLVTGGRVDYHSLFKAHFTYRLSGLLKVEKFSFRGGFSTGFRSPTLKELFTNWFHPWGGGFQIMGNQHLKPETSRNFNFSVDYDTPKLNVTAMTQLSSVREKIGFRWTASSDSIRYVNFSGDTRIISSELSATYRPHKAVRLKGSYAYYYTAKNMDENRPYTFTVKGEYIPPYGAKYVPNVVLSGKYVSAAKVYDASNVTEEVYTRYEPYSIWNLQLFSKLPYHFTVSAGVDNLLGYVAKSTSFYSSITPGRTYLIGLKWGY